MKLASYEITVLSAPYQAPPITIDKKTMIYIGGGVLAALVLIFFVIIPISRAQCKKRAKAKALKKFENEYGDLKVEIVAMLCGDDETQNNNYKQLDAMVNRMVKVPEGGKVFRNVKIDRKEE